MCSSPTQIRRVRFRRSLLWRLVGPTALLVGSIAIVTPVLQAVLAIRTEREREWQQLNTVVDALTGIRFPYTEQVLRRLKALTGAEFVLLDGDRVSGTLTLDSQTLHKLVSSQRRTGGQTSFSSLVIRGNRFAVKRLEGPQGQQVFVLYSLDQPGWRTAQAALTPLGVGLLVGLTGTVWLGWVVRRLTRDLARIRTAVEQLPAVSEEMQGDVATADELGQIYAVIRSSAERIRVMSEEIAEAERQKLTSRIATAFAHHLRNAVTAARLTVELHMSACDSSDQLRAVLHELELAEHQLRGLLYLSTPQKLVITVADLKQITLAAVEMLRERATHQGIGLTTRFPDELPPVRLNPEAWKTCLVSLLLNAIDAVRPGEGHVNVCAEATAGEVVIDVADNGPGLPPGCSLADMLKAYRSTGPTSLGLGLTIACQLLALMDATLEYERRDGWTHFVVRFPLTDTTGLVDGSGKRSSRALQQ